MGLGQIVILNILYNLLIIVYDGHNMVSWTVLW